ncbi:TetR/AcrR family transcriptional regulator [Rhodoferax sp.]|uniref:TetR/AcrR family transcriptional regulator n=1 Tax=Rhodoferax sp. TaxID=50421 RepID=UPI001EB54E18|nr:TetR/AcrR family transcriptional regulator [Rhodoferax sp.]MBT9507436.1 TetR/AcrR family transcriptional regulator [Rhodoferax sp.]
MGHSQADKANSRERILKEAATQIRAGGLASISVGKLMRSVNLTHGGFYGHFASSSELLSEAIELALSEGELKGAAADAGKTRGYSTMVRGYLSRTHRDSRETGCAIAALASEVSRSDEGTRSVMESHVESFIANIARTLNTENDEDAMVAVSAMIGALTLSRVFTDTKRSDALLRVVRDHVLALNLKDQD